MKTVVELLTDELKKAFAECGYDEQYAKVTVSNRPDLCEYQCNGAMAAAKAYKKAPFMIADDVAAKLAGSEVFEKVESVKPGFINLLDAFNSMGLPTSTTVSIVFELLGGAVAAALIKISTSDILLSQLGDFINSQKALAIVSGIVCDGAKASCAAKIASSVDAALLGYNMYKCHQEFKGGDGIVMKDIETTIKGIGRLGKDGMKETNEEIIRLMIE